MIAKARAWGQLLRVPNLLTVPGDPAAGFFIAWALGADSPPRWSTFAAAIGVSLLIYAAGLLFNDLFDLAEDRRDRPTRPLPSGAVRPAAVAIAGAVLMLAACAIAGAINMDTLQAAGALCVVVLVYDRFAKRIPVVGPVFMGACRGLSVIVGATAVGGWQTGTTIAVLVAAGIIAAYIALVTAIAAKETTGKPVGPRRNFPAMLLALCFTLLISMTPPENWDVRTWLFISLALAAVSWSALCAVRIGGTPEPRVVQKTIGGFIRGLLLIQAFFCLTGGTPGMIAAGILLVLWPISSRLGRWFYAS